MATLLFTLRGVRGRSMEVYDTKCIIKTKASLGSLLTSSATDGELTIFYIDCVGIQFKRSGAAIGFLQVETASTQRSNQSSNFFAENTFLFEEGVSGITNELMADVYQFISDRVEGYKYGTNADPLSQMPPYLRFYLSRQ